MQEHDMNVSFLRFVCNGLGDIVPSSCFWWRRFVLRLMGVRVDSTAKVCAGFRVYGSGSVEIGANVWIGRNCRFYTIGSETISISERSEIGPECVFNCQSHAVGSADHRAGPCTMHGIAVGTGVWIGTRATVLCSRIGSGAVIGAGAVVLHDVAENVLAAGIPAAEKKPYAQK